jgi:hypothetical protein
VFLNLLYRVEDELAAPLLADLAIVVRQTGVLMRLSALDTENPDTTLFRTAL